MAQVKEKRHAILNLLILMFSNMGMDCPNNIEEITDFCFDDVNETADPEDWHSGDVAIAFRRWIESKATPDYENVQDSNVQDGDILIPVSADDFVKIAEDFVCTDGLDGMYGNSLKTVGDLREAMSELCDEDLLTLVTIDLDSGDEIDHYPMHLDVIDGIELTNGKVVNEVQIVQEMNSKPDTRDKSELVDAVIQNLMQDYYHGDETVITELLTRLPWEILKGSLPEDRWEEFNPEGLRNKLIDRVMNKCYSTDDLKYYDSNRAYLETLSNDELEAKL